MTLINTNTQKDFEDKVLSSKKLVLVDFWAPWCGPCRMMSPVLENVAKSLDQSVEIVKVNIEESADNQQLASKYGVQGIPNMQLFKNGQKVDELIGMRPQAVLEAELKAHI